MKGEIEEMLSSHSPSSSLDSYSLPSSSSSDEPEQPFLSLNHVSFVCKSVSRSVRFYEEVLGFVLIKRPSSFDFEGAWLFNHGIGIHLLEVKDALPSKNKGKRKIDPKENHISFQCSNMDLILQKLGEMNIEYVESVVKEGGITVDQLFFHDPDGYMIEICNCQNLPVLPLSSPSSCPLEKLPPSAASAKQIKSSSFHGGLTHNADAGNNIKYGSGEVEALMMENLALDMISISF